MVWIRLVWFGLGWHGLGLVCFNFGKFWPDVVLVGMVWFWLVCIHLIWFGFGWNGLV